MKQRDLERMLQRVPPHPTPRADLEQYSTPAPIAADLLFRAYGAGDVADRVVLDLGCGTGILAIGAAVLGASRVIAVDVDEEAIQAGEHAAKDAGGVVDWQIGDAGAFDEPVDTVVMNPPFGAQVRGADRPFLQAAVRCAPVVYTLHLQETLDFVERFAADQGARLDATWTYDFPLKWQFPFQGKPVSRVSVSAVRLVRARN